MCLWQSNNRMRNGLTSTSFAHIAYLVEEIGPRAAGSPAAKETRGYLNSLLSSWGYQPDEQPIYFARPPKFDLLLPFTGLWLVFLSLWVSEFPWFSLALPIWGAALPQISRFLISKRPRNELDFNVVAKTQSRVDTPQLIICAHYDSAKASVFNSFLIRKIQSRLFDIYQRVAIFVSLVALLSIFQFPVPDWLLWGVQVGCALAGAVLLFTSIWEQIPSLGKYSPGANDNASGVGVLLALAEHYAHNPPGNLQLCFLFLAAEETGMHGSRAFVRSLSSAREPLVGAINVDMVGSGNTLRYVRRDGTIVPLSTSADLNEVIRQADPSAKAIHYTIKSGDYLPFIMQNIPAASLEVTGSPEAELAYHSKHDTLDLIDESALAMTLHNLQEVVKIIATGLQN